MSEHRVDYDRLAASYASRYEVNSLHPIGDTIIGLSRERRVLEVGCGTGRWLQDAGRVATFVAGVDASFGMLRQSSVTAALVNGRANSLPFRPASFDLVYCVNALHHFDDKGAFILDAAPLLRPGGTLAIIGIDPRTIRERYLYDYFASARSRDLDRYPSFGRVIDWMSEAGFDKVEHRIVDTWVSVFQGEDVLDDHFLRKDSNSSLVLLSETEYVAGLARMKEAAQNNARFKTVIPFALTSGRRPAAE